MNKRSKREKKANKTNLSETYKFQPSLDMKAVPTFRYFDMNNEYIKIVYTISTKAFIFLSTFCDYFIKGCLLYERRTASFFCHLFFFFF